jgi:hypothetical protein
VISVLALPPPNSTSSALPNKTKRKRVQHQKGEILTEDTVIERLKSEQRKSKGFQKPPCESQVENEKILITDASGPLIQRKLVQTNMDGNCMFSCFAQAIYGQQNKETVERIREETVDYICGHWKDFSRAIFASHKIPDVKEYSRKMKMSGTFGDHPEIAAISKLYDVKVIIHTGPLISVGNNFAPQLTYPNPFYFLLFRGIRHRTVGCRYI